MMDSVLDEERERAKSVLGDGDSMSSLCMLVLGLLRHELNWFRSPFD